MGDGDGSGVHESHSVVLRHAPVEWTTKAHPAQLRRVAIRKSAPATSPVLNGRFDAAETRRTTLVICQLDATTPQRRRNEACDPST
jgi:hypothetical protein